MGCFWRFLGIKRHFFDAKVYQMYQLFRLFRGTVNINFIIISVKMC
jgi:hypothetical protein